MKWLLLALSVMAAGCVPVTSLHTIADPDHVVEVALWETADTASGLPARFAVVHGPDARALVRCMTYERQDNPFCRVYGVVGVKGKTNGVLIRDDWTALRIHLADPYLFWPGPQGRLEPPFEALYARLPWQSLESPPTSQP